MTSRLEITRHDDVFVIRFLDRQLGGELPIQLGQEFYGVASQAGCTKILLNFSGVDFLASDMLGSVVSLNKMMKQKEGKLALCEVCPDIRQVLATTKLDTILTVKVNEAEGLSALA